MKQHAAQTSEELPSEGHHNCIIADIIEVEANKKWAVKFLLEEKDSQGADKFLWQEFDEPEMREFHKTMTGQEVPPGTKFNLG